MKFPAAAPDGGGTGASLVVFFFPREGAASLPSPSLEAEGSRRAEIPPPGCPLNLGGGGVAARPAGAT